MKTKNIMKYFFMAIALLLNKGVLSGQNITQYYDVIHNEQIVGTTVIKRAGDEKNFTISLNMSADINLFIKRVIILGKENVRFENHILKSGSVFRKVNEKIKTDNWIRHSNTSYTLHDGAGLHHLPVEEIRNDMLSIFFNEPIGVKRIYSDNQQRFVEIKASSGTYTVPGKNESQTTYIFKGGDCSRIILKSSLITLILKRK